MSLVEFYLGEVPDDLGRRLSDYWSWDCQRLEDVHDFIQWMFPLAEPSPVNPSAPTLDAATIAEFRCNPTIQQNLLKSLDVMLDFYGFTLDRSQKTITAAVYFKGRARNWLSRNNHNHLRITRILKCLMLCGLDDYALAFHAVLVQVARPDKVSSATLRFWEDAVR